MSKVPPNADGELLAKSGKVEVRSADICEIRVDAVVNAANAKLGGGSGVNGAIQKAAGPELLKACKRDFPNGCETGNAVSTDSFEMTNCQYIIHTVGPNVDGRTAGEKENFQLASCYNNSLIEARERGARSIAFPTISTGIYSFPRDRAAALAMGAVREFIMKDSEDGGTIDRVVFLIWPARNSDEQEYLRRFEEFFGKDPEKKAENEGPAAQPRSSAPEPPSSRPVDNVEEEADTLPQPPRVETGGCGGDSAIPVVASEDKNDNKDEAGEPPPPPPPSKSTKRPPKKAVAPSKKTARPAKKAQKPAPAPPQLEAPEPDPEAVVPAPAKKRARKRKATEEAEGSRRPPPAPPQPSFLLRGLEITMLDMTPAASRIVGGRTLRARMAPAKKRFV